MDGILIDSEPLWKEAEQEVLRKVGLELTDAQCAETTGLDIANAMQYWYNRQPWSGPSVSEVRDDLQETLIGLVKRKGKPCEGTVQILNLFKTMGWKIGLASSSPMAIIEASMAKLGLTHYFDVMHSSEFERASKPDPAVYIGAARRLGVAPSRCIAFEDSYRGVQSAHAAGMVVVAVPDPHLREHEGFKLASLVIGSLADFSSKHLNGFSTLPLGKEL